MINRACTPTGYIYMPLTETLSVHFIREKDADLRTRILLYYRIMKSFAVFATILLYSVATKAQQGGFPHTTYNATILESGNQICPSRDLFNRSRVAITEDVRAHLRTITGT